MKFLLLILLGIVLFSVTCSADVEKNKILDSTELTSNTFFVYYYGANLTTSKSFRLNNIRQLVRDPHYDAKKPTVLYVHGWEENQRQPNVAVIPHSYDIRGGWNVILLDWDRIAVGNYTIVWYNSIQLCKLVGPILLNAFNKGYLNIEKFHIVGHSLGAHCGSNIGQAVIDGGKKLQRITGLDPAGPLNYVLPSFVGATHLSRRDAKMVDNIHTDKYVYGIALRTGTADFYPNGGFRYQPGCPETRPNISNAADFCSHQKSVYYYAKSVSLSHGAFPFYAVSTNSWQYFINHVNINYKNTVKMGIDCPPTARGKYYLQTTDLPQMSLGNYGTYYHSDQT